MIISYDENKVSSRGLNGLRGLRVCVSIWLIYEAYEGNLDDLEAD